MISKSLWAEGAELIDSVLDVVRKEAEGCGRVRRPLNFESVTVRQYFGLSPRARALPTFESAFPSQVSSP